jgi:hypothetical protein
VGADGAPLRMHYNFLMTRFFAEQWTAALHERHAAQVCLL